MSTPTAPPRCATKSPASRPCWSSKVVKWSSNLSATSPKRLSPRLSISAWVERGSLQRRPTKEPYDGIKDKGSCCLLALNLITHADSSGFACALFSLPRFSCQLAAEASSIAISSAPGQIRLSQELEAPSNTSSTLQSPAPEPPPTPRAR